MGDKIMISKAKQQIEKNDLKGFYGNDYNQFSKNYERILKNTLSIQDLINILTDMPDKNAPVQMHILNKDQTVDMSYLILATDMTDMDDNKKCWLEGCKADALNIFVDENELEEIKE